MTGRYVMGNSFAAFVGGIVMLLIGVLCHGSIDFLGMLPILLGLSICPVAYIRCTAGCSACHVRES